MKQRTRRISALLLIAMLCVSMVLPAFATESTECPTTHTKSNCEYTLVSVRTATCTSQGYTVYQCNACEAYFADDFVDELGHESMTLFKEATCTEAGYRKTVCFNCDTEEILEETEALGHTWSDNTCEAYCTTCGATHDSIEGTDDDVHDWSEPERISAPYYDENGDLCPGWAKLTCGLCGLTKEVPIGSIGTAPEEDDDDDTTGGDDDTTGGEDDDDDDTTGGDDDDDDDTTCETHTLEWKYNRPTCTEGGSASQVCSACGYVANTVTLEANAHDYQVKVYAADANGYTLKQIAFLAALAGGDATMYDTTPYELYIGDQRIEVTTLTEGTETYSWTGDVIDEGIEQYASKCYGETGFIYYGCHSCGHSYTVYFAEGHMWEKVAETSSSCSEAGTITYVCVNPNCVGKTAHDGDEVVNITDDENNTVASKTVTKETLPHKWLASVTAPTCKEGGYTIDLCVVCGANNTEKGKYNLTAVNENAHDPVVVEGVEATCTEAGWKTTKCSLCEATLSEKEVVPATGHNLDKTKVVQSTAANCTTPGYKYYNCLTCGKPVEEEVAAAKGHNYTSVLTVLPNCVDKTDGYSVLTCANCGIERGERYNFVKYDETNVAYHNMQKTGIVENGDCMTPDTVKYECANCHLESVSYTAEDKSVHGNGHDLVDYKLVPATCLKNGTKAHSKCSKCDFITIDGTTAVTEDDLVIKQYNTEDDDIAEGLHCDVVVIPAKAPTCTEKGYEAGKQCAKCGEILEETKEIPANGHDYKKLSETVYQYNERTVTCTEWGYVFNQCTVCGDEVIEEYVAELGHKVVDVAAKDATCYSEGNTAGTKCKRCGEILSGCETIGKTAHRNAADPAEEFYTFTGEDGKEYAKCNETVTDLTCVYCETTYEKGHNYVTTLVEATCNAYSYELHVCVYCEDEYMSNPGFTYSDDHTWGDWTVTTPATATTEGVEQRVCSVCGETEERAIEALSLIDIALELENAVVEDADLTNSGLIALTIKTQASELDVWGVRLSIVYNSEMVSYAGMDGANAKFESVQVGTGTVGTVIVLAYAPNDASGATANITLDGDEALVTLYFRVAGEAEIGATADFATGSIFEVIDCDNNPVVATAPEAVTAEVTAQLGYVSEGETITISDAQAMMLYITGEAEDDYCAAADIDQDGDIDAHDFALMQNYLLGKIGKADLADAYNYAE